VNKGKMRAAPAPIFVLKKRVIVIAGIEPEIRPGHDVGHALGLRLARIGPLKSVQKRFSTLQVSAGIACQLCPFHDDRRIEQP